MSDQTEQNPVQLELNPDSTLQDSRLSLPEPGSRHSIVNVQNHMLVKSGSEGVSEEVVCLEINQVSERKGSLTGSGLLLDGNKPPVKRVSFSNTHSVINADSGEELVHVRHRDSITSASTDSSEDSTSSGEGGKMSMSHRSKMRPKLPVTTGTTKQISEMVQSSFENMTYECLMEEDWQPQVTSPVRKEFERRKSTPSYNSSDMYGRCDGTDNLPMSPTSPGICSPQHARGGKLPSQSQRMAARSHSRGSSISSVESSDSYQSQGSYQGQLQGQYQGQYQGQCFSPTGLGSHSYDVDTVASPSPLYDTIAPPHQQGQGHSVQKLAPPTAAKPGTGKKLRPQSTPSAGPQEQGHRRTASKSSLESVEEIPRAEEPMVTQEATVAMATPPATPTRGQYMKTPPPPPPVAKQSQSHLSRASSQPCTPTLNISAAQYHQTHSEPQLYGLDSPVDCFPTPVASQAPIPMSPPVGPAQTHMPMSPPPQTSSMSSPMSPRPSVHRHHSLTATPVSPPVAPAMPTQPLTAPPTPPLVPPTPRNPNTVVKIHKRRPSGDQRVIDGSQPMSRSLGSDYPDIAVSRPPIVMLSELPLPSTSRMASQPQVEGHHQCINTTEENNYAPLPFMAELNKHMHMTPPHNGEVHVPGMKHPPEKLPKPGDNRQQIKQSSPVPNMCSSQPVTAIGGSKSQPMTEPKKIGPPPPPRRSESTKLTSNTRTSAEVKSVPNESESIYGNCDGLLDINELPPPPPDMLEGYAAGDSSIKTGSGKGRPPPPPPPKRNKDTQISSSH